MSRQRNIVQNPTSVAPTTVAQLTPLADAAEFNSSFTWETDEGLYHYTPDLVGGDPIRDNPVLPHGENVPGTVTWQIDAGLSLDVSDGIITFGFYDHQHATGLNNNPSFGEGSGYTSFTEAQKAAARIAIHNWDDLIAPDFQEVNLTTGNREWAQNTTDIWLANTSTGPAQAWAYFPGYGNQYTRVAADVWIADPRYNSSNLQLDPGFYGLQTLNHELGHSLGLNHPGTYNFSDDNDGDGVPDPITYEGDAQYFQDSHQYTIMSYFDSYETGAQNIDWNVMRFVYPSTPMVDDVFVAQQKYGVETETRTGDTTYGFNATDDVWNEAMRFEDGEMFTIFTIWDAAGEDTLDLSGYYTDSVIDLREGAYSSAGGWGAYDPGLIGTTPTLAQINANNAAAGLPNRSAVLYDIYFNGGVPVPGTTGVYYNEGLSWKEITGTGEQYLMEQNIGIAYGAIIENAIGGAGNDRINGNQADNKFWGNAGSDTFILADYSGEVPRPDAPGTYVTINDTSIDQIMDFESGIDKIDVTELGVAWEDVTLTVIDGDTTQVTMDTDGDGIDDFTALVHGGAVTQTDFIFG